MTREDQAAVIETTTGCICMADGVICLRYHPGAQVDVDDAEADLVHMAAFAQGEKRPVFVDIGQVKSVSGGARNMYAGPRAAKVTLALALLVGSPISRVIGNFYLGLNKPTFPARLFTSESKALRWLGDFVDE